MSAPGRWVRVLWSLLNRRRLERELEREMAAHRAQMDEPGRFGSPLRLREQSADVWGWTWIDDLRQDLRYAFRLLRRSPGFAAAAISTLALGIGASTAIFSVVYGVALRPLPYPDADRLVRLYEANPRDGVLRGRVSEGAFSDWRAGAPALEAAALYHDPGTRFLAESGQPVTAMSVSPAFFAVLGAAPGIGRGFKDETEYDYRRGSDEVVLSYSGWQRLFGGRPEVIGSRITVRGARGNDVWTIIGVMPAAFSYGPRTDLWRPAIMPSPVPRIVRGWRYDDVVARLRRDASIAEARAEVEAVSARLAREFPATNAGWTVTVEPLKDAIVGDFGRASWLLFAIVAVVLVVTCVNVAGLLLARTVARAREAAVREALGAARGRLVRLALAESVLLASLGTALGLVVAWLGLVGLKAASPPGVPRLDEIALDRPVLAAAVASALLAVLTLTFAPLRAGRSTRRPVVEQLRGSAADGGRATRAYRGREALVFAQCAGAVVVVVLAAMLTRSVVKLTAVDLGWDADRILSLFASPPMPTTLLRPWYRYVEWSERLVARLEATPGIDRAAITTSIPFSPHTIPAAVGTAPANTPRDSRWSATLHHVTDRYFDLMGISVLEGRAFGPEDRFSESVLSSADASRTPGVAVVSRSLARTLWPGQPALGRRIWLPDFGSSSNEVVGVVEDLQFSDVGGAPSFHVFVPWTQRPTGGPFLLVRGTGDAASIAPAVRRVIGEVEGGTGVDLVAPLETLASDATARQRFTARTVALFAILVLTLAAIGVSGTLSYTVGTRTREIAIRLSLGASRAMVLPDVLRRGLVPVAAGGLVGVVAAAALARTFEGLLFQIEPVDAVSFVTGALLLLAAALAAALVPAIRVLRVNPARALRAE